MATTFSSGNQRSDAGDGGKLRKMDVIQHPACLHLLLAVMADDVIVVIDPANPPVNLFSGG